MYVAGANITVPCFVVVLRKSYGLGALAMSNKSALRAVNKKLRELCGPAD